MDDVSFNQQRFDRINPLPSLAKVQSMLTERKKKGKIPMCFLGILQYLTNNSHSWTNTVFPVQYKNLNYRHKEAMTQNVFFFFAFSKRRTSEAQ